MDRLHLGVLYFFLPLIATLEFSLRAQAVRSPPTRTRSSDPQFFGSLVYSFVDRPDHDRRQHAPDRADRLLGPAAAAAAAAGRRVRDAAAVRHPGRRPRLRLHPLVQQRAAAARRPASRARDVLLVAATSILSFPYMYRAVDTGLRAIDVRIADRGGAEPGRRLALRILWSGHPPEHPRSRSCRAPS